MKGERIWHKFADALRRETKVTELERAPISDSHVRVRESVTYTLGWAAILVLPYWALIILAFGGVVLYGFPPATPEPWFVEIFKITGIMTAGSIPLLFILSPNPETRTRIEWRRDTFPPSHMGV